MKTHEIGIGSFASVMINGRKKNTETAVRGERREVCIFRAGGRLRVHDRVPLIKKASEKDRKKRKEKDREKARFANSQFSPEGRSFEASHVARCGLSVCSPHTWKLHTLVEFFEEGEKEKKTLNEEEHQQNQPVLLSVGLPASLCSADPRWSFSSGTQAGTSQQPLALQLHAFDTLPRLFEPDSGHPSAPSGASGC